MHSKEIINDDKSFADEFNQFFLSVGPSAVYKIKSMVYEFSLDLDEESFVPKQYPLSEQFTFRKTECKHVEEIIMSLPSIKAPGNDKIPVCVIKDGASSILPTVTSIISTSLGTCTFPSIRKTAEVTPIPKKHEQASTNRSIFLSPVLSKVCKKIVDNQFSSCLN